MIAAFPDINTGVGTEKPLIGMSVTLGGYDSRFQAQTLLEFRTRHMHQTTWMHYAPFRFSTFFVSIDRVVSQCIAKQTREVGLSLCQNPKKNPLSAFSLPHWLCEAPLSMEFRTQFLPMAESAEAFLDTYEYKMCSRKLLMMSPLIKTTKRYTPCKRIRKNWFLFCRKIIGLARTQIATDEASQQVSHQIPRIMSITSVSKPETFSLYSLAFGGSRLGISMSLISPAASLR